MARAAIESAGTLGARRLPVRAAAGVAAAQPAAEVARRAQVLVGYGEAVVAPLAYFMRDRDEDIWVRRHVPVDAGPAAVPGVGRRRCSAALDDPDGFLRFKAMTALERLRRDHPDAGDRSDGRVAAHRRRGRRAPSTR